MASYSVGHGADTFASYEYTYDEMGRITGDGTYTYVYDELGQLVTVKDSSGTVVESYTYDGAGNILSANKNGTCHSYTYGNTNWRDQLTAYDGTAITYDEIGNPLSYRGWAFTWQNGRQLATASKSGTSISYAYDVNGLRYTKTVGGVTHSYIYSGSTLLQEKYGTTVLNFLYDADGTPYAVQYSTNSGSTFTTYYYITNLQGDIIGLMDTTGALVVSYTYDAWGVLLTTTGSLASTVGAVNPLRYRGYYYDTETSLYYLQSRYYDASVGRFISADGQISGVGGEVIGYNMFAYCFNNPINMEDDSGNWPKWAKKLVAAAVVVVAVAIVAVAVVATAGAGSVVAAAAVGAAKGAVVGMATGAVIGAVGGAISHRAATGSWKGADEAALNGMGDGALSGAVSGAVTGGIRGGLTYSSTPTASLSTNKPKITSTIHNDVIDLPRTGSALKIDAHHAFPDIVDNYAGYATKTPISNGTLYQLEGSLNGDVGRFEWIVQNQQVTHRMFVNGGGINGIPIKP